MNMAKRLLLCGLMLLGAGPTHAVPASARFEPEVEVGNLKRTRISYVKALVRDCVAAQGAASLPVIDVPALEQCITNSEIFSEVQVSVGDAITVELKERWTLIPIPFFRSQQDSTSYGLFVAESNFLGRGKLFFAGASTGSLGQSYLLMIQDPSVAFSDWTSRLLLQRSDEDVLRYQGDNKIDGFHQEETLVHVAPGYRFTPHLEAFWSVGYAARRFRTAEEFSSDPEDYRFWVTGPTLEFDFTEYKFFFQQGHQVKLALNQQFARSGGGRDATGYQLNYDWQQRLGWHNVLKLNAVVAGTSSADLRDSDKIGGDGSLRGIEGGGLWVRHVAGVTLDYQIPLWEGDFGTWAAGPFGAYARYQGPENGGEWEASRAYGAGLFLFLKEIAIPGIGVVVGRNPDFLGNFVDAQVGFGF